MDNNGEGGAAVSEAVQSLVDADGRPYMFMPLEKMDTSGGKMHFLVPSGVGDSCWVLAKFLPLKDRITFWLNNDQAKRAAPYFEMMGCKYDFCSVDIARLYEAPGEFTEEQITNGGFIGFVHANHHIESGKPLKDWHQFLPMVNPVTPATGRWLWNPLDSIPPATLERATKCEIQAIPIAVHMCSANYQEGNYLPKQWARSLRLIEEKYGPALVVGAYWDKRFAEQVFEHYRPSIEPMIDQPLADVFQAIRGCRAFIGLDSGLAIAAKYMGVPTAQFYPRWLATTEPSKRHPNGTHMPGTWEMDEHPKSMWGYVDQALDKDDENNAFNWLETL